MGAKEQTLLFGAHHGAQIIWRPPWGTDYLAPIMGHRLFGAHYGAQIIWRPPWGTDHLAPTLENRLFGAHRGAQAPNMFFIIGPSLKSLPFHYEINKIKYLVYYNFPFHLYTNLVHNTQFCATILRCILIYWGYYIVGYYHLDWTIGHVYTFISTFTCTFIYAFIELF